MNTAIVVGIGPVLDPNHSFLSSTVTLNVFNCALKNKQANK